MTPGHTNIDHEGFFILWTEGTVTAGMDSMPFDYCACLQKIQPNKTRSLNFFIVGTQCAPLGVVVTGIILQPMYIKMLHCDMYLIQYRPKQTKCIRPKQKPVRPT